MKQMKLFLGPQHPGMHGNASIHMYVDGDIIKKSYLLPGMLHRGFEKGMERKSYVQNISSNSPGSGKVLVRVKERLDESISSILILNTFAHTMGAATGGG